MKNSANILNLKSSKESELIRLKTVEDNITVFNQILTANTEVSLHKHKWGQLNIIDTGLIEININNEEVIIAPADYAVWIPAGIYHSSFSTNNLDYCSISIPLSLSHNFPANPRIIEVTEISRAIINDLLLRNIMYIESMKDQKLADVLIDQFNSALDTPSFLPNTNDRLLKPILDYFLYHPDNNYPLSAWAEKAHVSEKTLLRRFQKILNMTFIEWRSRFRFIKSIEMLKSSLSVQEIAYKLGYKHPSSFIQMFRKFSGTTPETYRKKIKLI